ncbi:MAG TPA: adenylate/guanylate cyclase domain-containing protein [Methylomirabilota bacterium]|nr:adenylate/guanylate cyclase domain-containing protein [Methylomirabilota bacterium]
MKMPQVLDRAPTPSAEAPATVRPPALRPWQRLSVRLAGLFATVTLLTVGLVGGLVYERQKRDVEETLGVQLLNIARTGALLIDAGLHADVQRTLTQESEAYARIRAALAAIKTVVVLPTPTYTLTDYDRSKRQARFMVTSDGPGLPGEPYPLVPELIEPLGRTFEDGVARHTRIYRNQSGTWITAFAPIADATGRTIAVLDVDYPVNVYLARLEELRFTLLQISVAGALGALLLGFLFARHLTRPVSALTAGVGRVAAGDLSRALPVRGHDEVGQLTRAFNDMLEGLRQRDFIRSTFGRYVSPEVARTLLESPEALRLGGAKREVTILMSDLRGYTRFAEHGDPADVMAILNACLGRLSEVVIAYGGTINEFIGDAIFAIFGAPLDHPDHAERAAAAALAMQRAMAELNEAHAARGLPRFEMGIGVNTGEAVVGNIGSEQRAKYGVVGSAVNTAARIEGATVGGQVFVSAATYERIRDIAEVSSPVSVEVKGLSEPLRLYELRGLAGRFDLRLPETADETRPLAAVALPLACWIIEGKTVAPDVLTGMVVGLAPRRLQARLAVALPPLTNVRLRLTYPALGHDSQDLYGKVVAGADHDLTCIRLTSVDQVDERIIQRLLAG